MSETMAIQKCDTCGGNLILKIGSDTAVCDHCGRSVAVDPQDVKKYQDIYRSAQSLMRTGTMEGCADALTRLRSIDFIPQANEAAEQCEKEMERLRAAKTEKKHLKVGDDGKNTAIGLVIIILTVLFLLAAAVGIGFVIWRLIKGELSQTEAIVAIAVAAVFVLLLLIGKLRS